MNGFDLQDAVNEILNFRKARNWEQFHTPKNLSMSIAIEAAELMEHFQWKDSIDENELEEIKEEIADVMSYLLMLSYDLQIDLNHTILDKVKKNAKKYPVEKCKGKYNKYDNL